jgi:hypothetical protein
MVSNLSHADIIPSHKVPSETPVISGISLLQTAHRWQTSERCFQDTGQSDGGTM